MFIFVGKDQDDGDKINQVLVLFINIYINYILQNYQIDFL